MCEYCTEIYAASKEPLSICHSPWQILVSAHKGNCTLHTSLNNNKNNSNKVHHLLTHQRNTVRSKGGRECRRRMSSSFICFALGSGSSAARVSVAKQPSFSCFLSLALPVLPLFQCYQTDVLTWSGNPREKTG